MRETSPTDDILRGIAFIAYPDKDGIMRHVGSVFFLGTEAGTTDGTSRGIYWVTARHVLIGIQGLAQEETRDPGCAYLRINGNAGCTYIRTRLSDWYIPESPTTDVAVFRSGLPVGTEVRATPVRMILDENGIQRLSMRVGDELLIPGLFTRSIGVQKNVPILRKGSIAFLADQSELVPTKAGPMFAHLIEAKSIGGLSGAPVYVAPRIERILSGKFGAEAPHIYLMGLISAHYPADFRDIDRFAFDPKYDAMDHLNSGIAVVTPVATIVEVLEEEKRQLRQQFTAVLKVPLSFEDVAVFEISNMAEVAATAITQLREIIAANHTSDPEE